tara:strand:- start:3317 stop:4993 length:1677 start_codon:yes stop_codon:yes gene_type:complete
MPNVHYTDVQFGTQNVFRTVTVAYQPYIPFTQAYRMQIEGGQATMASQGASSAGYFKMSPQDAAGIGDDERDGYPWTNRLQAYQGAGEGRLAGMSTMMNREASVLKSARQIEGGVASSVMGQQLSEILNYGATLPTNAFQSRSSRIASELELEFLDNLFSEHGISTSQRTLQRGSDYGQAKDFDMYLENNDTFRQFLTEELGSRGLSTDELHSFELEDRRSNYSHKILSRIDAEGMSVSGARRAWGSHIHQHITQWNARIVQLWNSGSNVASRTSQDFTNARELFTGGSSMDYEIRQFMNRMARNEDIRALDSSVANVVRHAISSQLGGNYVGFATFYPDRTTGTNIPQIGWDGLNTARPEEAVIVIGTSTGRVAEAFLAWAGRNGQLIGTTIQRLGAMAAQEAADVAVSTEARLLAMGQYGIASNLTSIMGGIRPTVSMTHLTSTDIALSLSQQIQEHFNNPQTTTAFGEWYRELIEKSNDLSRSWHSAVGVGPVFGHSLSEEWQFGDDAGNPRKHYLGLWNKADEDAWKGDLTTGYNFSISPMVISRRAGTASFGQ